MIVRGPEIMAAAVVAAAVAAVLKLDDDVCGLAAT